MKKVLLILLLLIGLSQAPEKVQACSCLETPSPKESLEKANAVFAGQVMEVREPKSPLGSTDTLDIIFSLTNTWKGPSFKSLKVHTPASSAACGASFVVGKEYLVYAGGTDSFLQINLCDRIVPVSEAAEDFIELGDGQLPTEINNRANYYLAAQSLGIIIVILALWAFIIYKKNK